MNVRGPELKQLASKLRRADRDVRTTIKTALAVAAAEGARRIPVAAEQELPHSGGLAQSVADNIRVTPAFIDRRDGVDIWVEVTAGKYDLAAMDAGRVRHPLYGDTNHWYLEKVRPGFFTRAIGMDEVVVSGLLAGVLGVKLQELERSAE